MAAVLGRQAVLEVVVAAREIVQLRAVLGRLGKAMLGVHLHLPLKALAQGAAGLGLLGLVLLVIQKILVLVVVQDFVQPLLALEFFMLVVVLGLVTLD